MLNTGVRALKAVDQYEIEREGQGREIEGVKLIKVQYIHGIYTSKKGYVLEK
jgi:hypothetical protein